MLKWQDWWKRRIAEVLQHTSFWKSGLTSCCWLDHRAVVQTLPAAPSTYPARARALSPSVAAFAVSRCSADQHCVCGARLLGTEPHQVSIPLVLRRRHTGRPDAGFMLCRRSQRVPSGQCHRSLDEFWQWHSPRSWARCREWKDEKAQ